MAREMFCEKEQDDADRGLDVRTLLHSGVRLGGDAGESMIELMAADGRMEQVSRGRRAGGAGFAEAIGTHRAVP